MTASEQPVLILKQFFPRSLVLKGGLMLALLSSLLYALVGWGITLIMMFIYGIVIFDNPLHVFVELPWSLLAALLAFIVVFLMRLVFLYNQVKTPPPDIEYRLYGDRMARIAGGETDEIVHFSQVAEVTLRKEVWDRIEVGNLVFRMKEPASGPGVLVFGPVENCDEIFETVRSRVSSPTP